MEKEKILNSDEEEEEEEKEEEVTNKKYTLVHYKKDPSIVADFASDKQALAIYWNHADHQPQMLDDEYQLSQAILIMAKQGVYFNRVVHYAGYILIVLQCRKDTIVAEHQPPVDPMSFQLGYMITGFVFVCKPQCLMCHTAYVGKGKLDMHCSKCAERGKAFRQSILDSLK